MNMIWISIIAILMAVVGWLLLNYFADNTTMKVQTAFAGVPTPKVPSEVSCELPKREVKTYMGSEAVSLSNLERIIIKGHSLEKLGILDNSMAYVSLWNDKNTIESLPGRFIILNIDNERTIREHPLEPSYFHSDGKKARKVLKIVDVGMDSDAVSKLCDNLLKDLDEVEQRRLEMEIRTKYEFASQYYGDRKDKKLIMSLTYRRDGRDLGFSFHSPRYLYGVIEYVSNNSHIYETRA